MRYYILLFLSLAFAVYATLYPQVLNGHEPGVIQRSQLTSGELNPNITQENIFQNICNPDWSTKSIRPSSSYTGALKKKQLEGGYTVGNSVVPADYEEDHLISLELGGDPTSVLNLWPQSYKTTPGAKDKDMVENYLHKQVCLGAMTLAEAQKGISTDWTQYLPRIKKLYGSTISSIDNDDN